MAEHTPVVSEEAADAHYNPQPEIVGVTAERDRVVDPDAPEAALLVNPAAPIPKAFSHLFTEKGSVREKARTEGIPHPVAAAQTEAERAAARARVEQDQGPEETSRKVDITGRDEAKKPSK